MTTKRRKITAFITGSAFGMLLLLLMESTSSYNQTLVKILGFPARIGLFISDLVLWPICKLDTTNICRGLGLDGGPLAWVEWLGLYSGMIVGYGLIFLFVYVMYLKKKK